MAKVMLELNGISIELEQPLDIQRHKELGYKEVKPGKAPKVEAAPEVPSLDVPEEKPKAKAKAKAEPKEK